MIFFIIIILIIIGLTLTLRGLNGGEDNWIKDSKGIYIKHGNPSITPENVLKQREAISCGILMFEKFKNQGMKFNSQCLGSCKDYSIDIVNVPRNSDDDKVENQCIDFRSGVTHNFIEFDKYGNIIRIVD